MKYFSSYTEECLKDAQKNNLTNELDGLVKKIEQNQTAKFLEKYRSPAVVKRAGRFRFIGYEKIFNEIVFVVVLRILIKGRPEYESFCENSERYCLKYLPGDDWFKNKILEKQKLNIKERSSLSEIEKEYLFNSIPDNFESSVMVYESKNFIEEIGKSEYKLFITEMIREILETNNSDQYNQIKHKSKNNIIVFYKFFRNSKLLYLHAFLNDQDKNKKDFKDLVILNENDVLKLSYRSYPDFILYDEDTWLEIQKETEGNLALSTEEAKILNSIIHNSFDEPLFPLFINGRAGSGKSTLLYYIFSYILLNHILQEKKLNNPPIFLTYSPKLLETAINSIKKIIKTNVRLRHSLKDNEVKSVEKYINSDLFEKSFITFREFQKGLLDKRLIEKFQDINYYRFSNFKEDWMRYCKTNPIKFIRGISSEFAWYVIRTFIKGMRSNAEEYLEPDEYDLLPRELKTIDLETYEKIYKNVFLSWYKKHLEDNDYWDDQDLTRAVLTKLENNSFEYPAVFCDEAQDFSNIELELISELSLFSKRKLEFRDIKRVPLAFAGDPLQTINPTGFNWETIKANFYEKIQSDYGRISKAQINYKELNNNYRSSKGIIIFNNTIQLLRVLLFNLKNITPQEAWFQSEFIINPTLKIDDLSILEEALRDSAKLKTIIIPCEEDQEKEYILNRDSFLKQRAIINGEVSQNIWSPMNVKGLEYNTVIIYNFGEYLCNSISINLRELVENLINNSNFSIDLSKSKKIELEYFLNKLYVATSRAKKCLIIVDTQQGYDFLWSIFDNYSKQLVESYSNLFNDNIDWDIDNNISEFQFSTEVVNTEDDNPEYLAYSYYKDGLSSYNPRKLRSAAEYFRFCQKHTEANRSLAKAYEFENNFIRAAEYYEKIQEGDEATKCYWRTNDPDKYQKIVSVFSKIPLNPNNIFYLASKFLLTENKKEESILCLRDFYKLIKISERNDFYIISHNNWKPFYNSLLSSLKDYSLEFPNLNDWDDVIDILKKLGELGVQIKKQRDYIELLFNLKQYNDVINELKENNDTENDLFIKANALSITYPGNLEYYFKLKDYNQINSLYLLNKNKLESLKFYELEIILKSLIESQDLNSLKVFLSNHFDQISDLFGESLLERVLLIAFEKRFYAIGFDIIQKLRHRKEDEFFANIIKSVFHLNDVRIITYFVCLFLSQEITFNRFHTVVDILERKRAIFDFIPDELINKASLEKVLLFFLAKKTDFKASKEPRERIQSYVKNLLVEDNRWRNLCSLQVASAAIERLEYHINSREFYEKIIKSNLFNDIDVYYAKKRWLKVKMKQSLTMKDDIIKTQILDEVEKFYKKWGFEGDFKLNEIEEYPIVFEELDVTLEESYEEIPYKSTKAHIINFKCSFFIDGEEKFLIKSVKEKGLLKIDYLSYNESIYYDIKNKIFDSKEVEINLLRNDENYYEYQIHDWKLSIVLEKIKEKYFMSFFYLPERTEFFKLMLDDWKDN